MSERITARQLYATVGEVAWRVFPEGAYTSYRAGTFAAAVAFVDEIGSLVRGGEEPDIDIRGDRVTVLLRAFRGATYGLHQPDLDLAVRITQAASARGLTPDPASIQSLLIIPGATDRASIMPFWQAVLAYEPRADSPDEDLVDPHDRGAPFWFEEMDAPRADGNGSVHMVVWLPWDQAEARMAAGLAAGGRLVRHNLEEGFWTLADPAGNEVDLATTAAPA